jgi:hypothetical protein
MRDANMKVIIGKFITWFMGLTRLMRCFVIAVLFHVVVGILLGSIKIVAILPKIIASFDAAALPPVKVEEPDPFAAFRDFDYNGPTLGGGGGTPGKGPGGIPSAAGTTPTEYKASITAPDQAADSQIAEVIGVVSESASAIARIQTSVSGLSAPTTGLGEGKIGTAGIKGPGGGGFGQRVGPMRAQWIAKYKGSVDTEKAVLAALRWMKNNQQPNGSWAGTKNDHVPALAALGALAFLGHGETPDSGEFGVTVNKVLQYLVSSVGPDGRVSPANMYGQGAAMLALSEAYSMTQSPAVKEPLGRLINAAVAGQKAKKKDGKDVGGWRYSLSSDDSDTSVTGWIVMGLKSARWAGLTVPDETFEGASSYLWQMCDNEGFGYTSAAHYPSTTALGVLCQQFMGHRDDRRIKKSLDFLKQQKANWNETEGYYVLYMWYYITQAMFQGGGSYWEYWNRQIRDTMVKSQLDDGRWMPPPKSKEETKLAKSPAYSTALGCLILEVYYRYLPIYQEMEKKPAPAPVAP